MESARYMPSTSFAVRLRRKSTTRLESMLRAAAILCFLALGGCTSFVDVRSAEVHPGLQGDVGLTVSTPPGDLTAWFYSFECVDECNHAIVSPGVALRFGRVPQGGGRPFELGAGFSGMFPYAAGYVQLKRAPHAFGVGARIGIPSWGWQEHALFARYDLTSGSTRVVFSPHFLLHHGGSANGFNRGYFAAFAPAFGVQMFSDEGIPVTASLIPVFGKSGRWRGVFEGTRDYEWPVFLVAGLSLTFQRAR